MRSQTLEELGKGNYPLAWFFFFVCPISLAAHEIQGGAQRKKNTVDKEVMQLSGLPQSSRCWG